MALNTGIPLPWQEEAWHRLAEARRRDRLPHALLLSGPRGLGKRAFGEALAAALLCSAPESSGHACGRCRSCRLLAAGTHPDFHCIEPEAPDRPIRIEAIRDLCDETVLSVGGGRRVFLLVPAESMGTAAANALLKTLEEPPAGIHLLLVSHRPEHLPVTIRSRCNPVPFRLPSPGPAIRWLVGEEGVDAERAELALALSGGGPLAARELLREGDLEAALGRLEDLVGVAQGGRSPVAVAEAWQDQAPAEVLLREMAGWLTALVRAHAGASGALESRLAGVAVIRSAELHLLLDKVLEAQRRLVHNPNPRLLLETLLVDWRRLARRDREWPCPASSKAS